RNPVHDSTPRRGRLHYSGEFSAIRHYHLEHRPIAAVNRHLHRATELSKPLLRAGLAWDRTRDFQWPDDLDQRDLLSHLETARRDRHQCASRAPDYSRAREWAGGELPQLGGATVLWTRNLHLLRESPDPAGGPI